jgi:hypothetical protein
MSLSSCGGSSTGPGQAVVADGPLVCCVMRRADFERLLGPYDELWRYEALRKVGCAQYDVTVPCWTGLYWVHGGLHGGLHGGQN